MDGWIERRNEDGSCYHEMSDMETDDCGPVIAIHLDGERISDKLRVQGLLLINQACNYVED
jgi:hypothetical protein